MQTIHDETPQRETLPAASARPHRRPRSYQLNGQPAAGPRRPGGGHRINKSQASLYWREWSAARRTLLRRGYSNEDADAERHIIHTEAIGEDKSHTDFTQRNLDDVLDAFRGISQGVAALETGNRRRLLYSLNKLAKGREEYIAEICQDVHGHRQWRVLSDEDLGKVRKTMAHRVERKPSMTENRAPSTEHRAPSTEHRALTIPHPASRIMQTPAQAAAQSLHAAYLTATGYTLTLDMARERAWLDLHNLGITADDVRLVVRYIKWGIKRAEAGKTNGRNIGALRFREFTAPDKFEEDLNFAREKARMLKEPAAVRSQESGVRSQPAPAPPSERATVADIAAAKAALMKPQNAQAHTRAGGGKLNRRN